MTLFRMSSILLDGFSRARAGYKSKPRPDNRWGRLEVRRLAWNFHDRLRSCFRLARRSARMTMKYETTIFRKLEKLKQYEIFSNRIDAGARPHGIAGHEMTASLTRMNVHLNPKILADLAIYEPISFQCLCISAKQHMMNIGIEESKTTKIPLSHEYSRSPAVTVQINEPELFVDDYQQT